jgi:hypothetical protein
MRRIGEAIDLCLEEADTDTPENEFIGVQRIAVG